MKNKTSFLSGLRNLFYVLLVVVILQSCGNRAPIINGEKPFIVEKIEKYNETHSKYYAADNESGIFYSKAQGRPLIVLPSGMYQIGDTIKSGFNNH